MQVLHLLITHTIYTVQKILTIEVQVAIDQTYYSQVENTPDKLEFQDGRLIKVQKCK